MGSQRAKEEPKEEAPQKAEQPQAPEEKKAARKWKGKDWFTVLAPAMFAGRELGEIPATDPQSLIGRRVEVPLSQLTGNPAKYYLKLLFKVTALDGNRVATVFNGLGISREHVFRVVRKRTARVDVVRDVLTKDGWALRVKAILTLNRAVETTVQKKVRLKAMGMVEEIASKSGLDDFIKAVCEDLLQKNIKKYGSKIYPIRFCEVTKVEVRKRGEEPAGEVKGMEKEGEGEGTAEMEGDGGKEAAAA